MSIVGEHEGAGYLARGITEALDESPCAVMAGIVDRREGVAQMLYAKCEVVEQPRVCTS